MTPEAMSHGSDQEHDKKHEKNKSAQYDHH